MAYMRAVGRFCQWLEVHKIELRQIEPTLVAAYVEELMPIYAAPSVKQHLARSACCSITWSPVAYSPSIRRHPFVAQTCRD